MSMRNPQNERYTVEREGRSQGSVKPRTASAKPASKAGASVRTTSKPKPKNAKQRAMAEMNMSKEEKKAARAKERAAEREAKKQAEEAAKAAAAEMAEEIAKTD